MRVFSIMLRILEVFVVVTVIVTCIEGRPQGSPLNEVAQIFAEIRGNLGEHGNIELIEVVPSILVYETDLQQPGGGTAAYSGGGIKSAPASSPGISGQAAKSILGAGG